MKSRVVETIVVFLLCGLSAPCQKRALPCPETAHYSKGKLEWIDCKGHVVPEHRDAGKEKDVATPTATSKTQDDNARSGSSEVYRAQIKAEVEAYQHATDVYRWQHTSSIIIFWVVVTLVLSGLILAAAQFYLAMQAQLAHTKVALKADTRFEASLTGLKVSSSVIGFLILTISMAFFVLYLKFVYPIHNN